MSWPTTAESWVGYKNIECTDCWEWRRAELVYTSPGIWSYAYIGLPLGTYQMKARRRLTEQSEYVCSDSVLQINVVMCVHGEEAYSENGENTDNYECDSDANGNGFTVIEEYLAGFGDGSGPDAISYGIDNGALTLTSDLDSGPSGITVVLQATSDLSVAFANVAFTASVVDNGDATYTRSYTETDNVLEHVLIGDFDINVKITNFPATKRCIKYTFFYRLARQCITCLLQRCP